MATGKNSSNDLVLDRVFNLADSARCSLFVRVAEEGFQFCIHDPERDAIVAVGGQEGVVSPEDALATHDGILKNEFRRGTIAYHSSKSMLLPVEMRDKAAQCLSMNFGAELNLASFSVIDEIDLGFATSSQAVEIDRWLETFPFLQVQSSQVMNLELMARKHKFSKGWSVYVDCHHSSVDVYVWNNSKLHLYNSFEASGPNDVLYHVSNVCQQLEIDLQGTILNFSGKINHEDELDDLVKKYIPKYSISPGLQHVKLALGLSSVRKQHFATLFNQASCGL